MWLKRNGPEHKHPSTNRNYHYKIGHQRKLESGAHLREIDSKVYTQLIMVAFGHEGQKTEDTTSICTDERLLLDRQFH